MRWGKPWIVRALAQRREATLAHFYEAGYLDGQWQYTRRRLSAMSARQRLAYSAGWADAEADGLLWQAPPDLSASVSVWTEGGAVVTKRLDGAKTS